MSNLLMVCKDQNADWPQYYGVNQRFGLVAVHKIVYNLEFYSVCKLNVIPLAIGPNTLIFNECVWCDVQCS